jgi:hypothetical protein
MAKQEEKSSGSKVLSFLNLSDQYERRARFFPALLTVALLVPLACMVGAPLTTWLAALSMGAGCVGIAAAATVGLSHLASAAGNRMQKKLFPRTPHDLPTNLWLHPADPTCSQQQKDAWYGAIKRLTNLDIAAAAGDPNDAERVINDAVAQLRTRILWRHKLAERMDLHNAEFGFARNLAGLRPAWLTVAAVSCGVCWCLYAMGVGGLTWPVVSSALLAMSLLAAVVQPDYVKHAAKRYADSFFGALAGVDEATSKKKK